MKINHPYPEIGSAVRGYTSPYINDRDLLADLSREDVNKLYLDIRSNIAIAMRDKYNSENRHVSIKNEKTGEIVFDATVEFPSFWSEMSVTIFASKYLIRNVEFSLYGAVARVVGWIVVCGIRSGYFKIEDAIEFGEYLASLICEQKATFNSPVWFNVCATSEDVYDTPYQTSACFVNQVKDDMGSIIALNNTNQMIALGGSGSGVDMTPIRSRREWIGKQQGRPSGPVGFLVMFDAVLQATRSAGRFRRAAGLVSLKQHHQDILDFIRFKAVEEEKGKCLSENLDGWDHSFAAEGQKSIFGTLKVQNINTAVRLTEEFWDGYYKNGKFPLRDRHGNIVGEMDCDELLREIATAQLKCGDPGVQFDDNVNNWNPFLKHDASMRFNSSNACQPLFAPILTPDGIKTLDEVDVDSIIWSGKKWTKITHKVHTGIKPVFAYHTMCGSVFCTDDHRVIQSSERVCARDATHIDVCPDPYQARFPNMPNTTAKIEKVSYIGMFDVYDIRVEAEEHTYWTGGLLVSNCSEIQYLDNSACNLASINIEKFITVDGGISVDLAELKNTIYTLITAQDIMVDWSYYPTAEIAKTSYETRNLGLNYGNLGYVLFKMGLPYDSNQGRLVASCITAYITAVAFEAGIEIAESGVGPFKLFSEHREVREGMYDIIRKHFDHTQKMCVMMPSDAPACFKLMAIYAANAFEHIVKAELPIRNATVTAFVPQGTVGLSMDQKTTGIESFISHDYNKELVGGGKLDFANGDYIAAAVAQHKKVYGVNADIDKLMQTAIGSNAISPIGHVKMLAAVQPFISLGISKTCNMPSTTTVDNIVDIYVQSHKMGVKCVTVYVDGSKVLQPLKENKKEAATTVAKDKPKPPTGVVLADPSEVILRGWTIQLGSDKFYIKFGFHPDNPNMIWEIWLEQSFCGGTVDGMAKTLAVMISRELQAGIRAGKYAEVKASITKSLAKMTFPPNGFIGWNKGQPEVFKDIHSAQSLPNLLAQMMSCFTSVDANAAKDAEQDIRMFPKEIVDKHTEIDLNAPICGECGRRMFKLPGSSHCFGCSCGNNVGGCGG